MQRTIGAVCRFDLPGGASRQPVHSGMDGPGSSWYGCPMRKNDSGPIGFARNRPSLNARARPHVGGDAGDMAATNTQAPDARLPSPRPCTDHAAMIAWAGLLRWRESSEGCAGLPAPAAWDADPGWGLAAV